MISNISAVSNVFVDQKKSVASNEENGSELFGDTLLRSIKSRALTQEDVEAMWEKSGSVAGAENTGSFITAGDTYMDIKQSYIDFTTLFDDALASEGICKDPVFEVFADSNGDLYINSDHPDKGKIEKILNETDGIKEAFLSMSENSSTEATMHKWSDAIFRCSGNPQDISKQYSSMYGTEKSKDVFSIKMSENWALPRIKSDDKYVDLDVFRQIEDGDMSDPSVRNKYELEFEYLQNS